MTDLTPKHFDKSNPCTKIDLHNCFYRGGQYVDQPVIQAKTVIGENAPKYLIREGFVVVRSIKNVDYYCITPEGSEWLRKGVLRYLEIHPERAVDCTQLPAGVSIAPIRRSARPPAKTVPPTPPVNRRIIRRSV